MPSPLLSWTTLPDTVEPAAYDRAMPMPVLAPVGAPMLMLLRETLPMTVTPRRAPLPPTVMSFEVISGSTRMPASLLPTQVLPCTTAPKLPFEIRMPRPLPSL